MKNLLTTTAAAGALALAASAAAPVRPAVLVTADQLRRLSPKCDAETIAPLLDKVLRRRNVTSDRRIRHFMAQLCHESIGLTRLVESLTYTTPERIRKVWPKRFPTVESARPFVRNPQALANKVYGGRMGNKGPNDGWRYRGSGPGMITGRDNFALVSALIGIDVVSQPELLRTWEFGLAAFGGFWATNGLNAVADVDDDEVIAATLTEHLARNEEDDLVEVTQGVNGGRIGLDDRRHWLKRAAEIWSDR